MPKSYSKQEREFLKSKLKKEARDCLSHYGVKKTTVDELCKRVGIPKGTFYLFYRSKELLFFDVLNEIHHEMHQKLFASLKAGGPKMGPEEVTDLIFELYQLARRSSLLNLFVDGELELILRRLPEEVAEEHANEDDFSVEHLISLLPGIRFKNVREVSAALRAIFLSMLHRHEIGEDIFDDAMKLMIRGVVLQMYEGALS